VCALLDAGAPVDAREDGGPTALQVATRWGEAEVVALLRGRSADASAVTELDRALGEFVCGVSGPPRIDTATLDAMLMIAVQQGDAQVVERLLDAGASVNGDPAGEDVPIGHAAWRGYPVLVSLLVARGARLDFPDGGDAIGAALHGSRHCNHPEGGPTMRTVAEIPQAPYAAIVRTLLAAGARVPERPRDGALAPQALVEDLLRESGA
jgi:hypothetical protein